MNICTISKFILKQVHISLDKSVYVGCRFTVHKQHNLKNKNKSKRKLFLAQNKHLYIVFNKNQKDLSTNSTNLSYFYIDVLLMSNLFYFSCKMSSLILINILCI